MQHNAPVEFFINNVAENQMYMTFALNERLTKTEVVCVYYLYYKLNTLLCYSLVYFCSYI